MKQYFFMSGLPRSGSTLLGALINQHPQVHCGAISPVLEMMYHMEQYAKTSEQYLAYPKPQQLDKIISSYIENFYEDVDKPFIIDKSRAWPNNVERVEKWITQDVKIICPVRPVLEQLSSFIDLIHRNPEETSYIDKYLIERKIPVNDANRCDYLMSPEGIIDQSLYAFSQGYAKGREKNMLLVEYDHLVNNTQATMDHIYRWLGVPGHTHDLENIDNKYREDDSVYDLKDMHEVRKRIARVAKRPEEVLSAEIIAKYSGLDFWRKPKLV